MADADEDDLRVVGPSTEDIDLSDETQDFRFLNQVSFSSAGRPSIPKRGEKDFEPHSTTLQSDTLAASRDAMHNALSTPRIHKAKQHNIATYHPESNMASLERPKGSVFQKIGHNKGNVLWLLPEEALFMLERGSLDVRWPIACAPDSADVTKEDAAKIQRDMGVPMSLQGAYAAFLGMEREVGGKLTQDMYSVYTALKRSGYIVIRADGWNEDRPPLDSSHAKFTGFKAWWNWLFGPRESQSNTQLPFGPLVKPGLYRNYNDIYRALALIPTHDQYTPPTFALPSDPDNPYRIVYNVYKPESTFKKSDPGEPDIRLAIASARDTPVPNLGQINDLFASVPYQPPPDSMNQLYQKIRHGHRNVVLALVDQGVTSYLRLSDASFGSEKVYERKAAAATRGKRGGGRGGRGRGRGCSRGS